MTMKVTFLLFSLFLFLHSCNSIEPPPNDSSIALSLEDVSSIEAWIKLTTTNLQLPTTVTLKQSASGGNTITQDIILSSVDSVLYIDSLLPNTTYNFQASSSQPPITSNQIQVTTMDTTSHNFTWQTWTFGEHSSSVLNDVAIIDENNIWAVGEIYLNDSLGIPDPLPYNAAHWNGSEWELKRITVEFRGNLITPPLEGLYAFAADDIWMVGSLPLHGDGDNWEMFDLRTTVDPNLSLSKAWGSNTNNMYFVGRSGSIAHYNGQSWQKIESGTDLHINDIWGDYNNSDNYEILCIASNQFINEGNKILQISSTVVTPVNNNGLSWALNTIWFIPERKYFVGGDGLYSVRSLNDEWIRNEDLPSYYKTAIRGIYFNDIIVVGAFGLLLHYNGVIWRNFQDITLVNGALSRVDINGNLISCVGSNSNQAIVLIGQR